MGLVNNCFPKCLQSVGPLGQGSCFHFSLGRGERNLINQQASKSNNRGVQINHRYRCSRYTWFLWNRQNQMATLPSDVWSHRSRSSPQARTTAQGWASFRILETWKGREGERSFEGTAPLSAWNRLGPWSCRYKSDQAGASYPGYRTEPPSTLSVGDLPTGFGKAWTMVHNGNWTLRRFKLSQSQERFSTYFPCFSHSTQGISTPLLHSKQVSDEMYA